MSTHTISLGDSSHTLSETALLPTRSFSCWLCVSKTHAHLSCSWFVSASHFLWNDYKDKVKCSFKFPEHTQQTVSKNYLDVLTSQSKSNHVSIMTVVGESAISKIPKCKLGSMPVSSHCTINRVTVLRPNLGFYMYLTFFSCTFLCAKDCLQS